MHALPPSFALQNEMDPSHLSKVLSEQTLSFVMIQMLLLACSFLLYW